MSLEMVINGEQFILQDCKAVTMESMLRKIAKAYGLPISNLKSSSQGKRCQPRQVAMYLIREYFGLTRSYRQIADLFGLRDHTAVIHACRLIARLVEQDAALQQKIEELKVAIDFDSRSAPQLVAE